MMQCAFAWPQVKAWYGTVHTHMPPKPLVFARALASAETTQPQCLYGYMTKMATNLIGFG